MLAAESGELAAYGDGRVIDRAEFLADALDALEGSTLAALGGDRYRAAEIEPVLKAAALPASCAIVWRGQGAGQFAHGSRDVRAFQSAVEGGRLLVVDGLLAAHAYAGCCLRRDPSGNPALDKSRASSRIDLLSALVIAAGLAALAGELDDVEVGTARDPLEGEPAAPELEGPDYGIEMPSEWTV